MMTLATEEEKHRWELARRRLGTVLDRLSEEAAREKAVAQPNARRLAAIDAQWRGVSERRYNLSMHDHGEIADVLANVTPSAISPARRCARHSEKNAQPGARQDDGPGVACCGRCFATGIESDGKVTLADDGAGIEPARRL